MSLSQKGGGGGGPHQDTFPGLHTCLDVGRDLGATAMSDLRV